ncbi:MAG TPA: prepilin-type N-terminal cleavage/methylation domain-containing protein [Gammaproteobacteria bacterium]|nr:prepilin-type N-terminal cleavage/methylation domain-containing protein [Gammaproteobacteria bacterium]
MKQQQSGFTLVEIAIVLVIIGILLGGILKGQEMITNAKVRNVVDQGSAIKAAFFAFQDRYRALPGDYSVASTNIAGVSVGVNGGNGDGNGRVDTNNDRGLFWLHLAAAGFITGNFDGQANANNINNCPSTRCATNAFGRPLMFSWGSAADGTNRASHELRTGRSIPVEVLAEIDRKVDDGIPRTGKFQVDQSANASTCRTGAGAASTYQVAVANPQSDCGGVHIF